MIQGFSVAEGSLEADLFNYSRLLPEEKWIFDHLCHKSVIFVHFSFSCKPRTPTEPRMNAAHDRKKMKKHDKKWGKTSKIYFRFFFT